jgi:hypothetical protein
MLIILLQVLVLQKEGGEQSRQTQTRGPVRVRAGVRTVAAAETTVGAVETTVASPTITSTMAAAAVVEMVAR